MLLHNPREKALTERIQELEESAASGNKHDKENAALKRQLANARKKRRGEVKLLKRCYDYIIDGRLDLFLKGKLEKVVGRKRKKKKE